MWGGIDAFDFKKYLFVNFKEKSSQFHLKLFTEHNQSFFHTQDNIVSK